MIIVQFAKSAMMKALSTDIVEVTVFYINLNKRIDVGGVNGFLIVGARDIFGQDMDIRGFNPIDHIMDQNRERVFTLDGQCLSGSASGPDGISGRCLHGFYKLTTINPGSSDGDIGISGDNAIWQVEISIPFAGVGFNS